MSPVANSVINYHTIGEAPRVLFVPPSTTIRVYSFLLTGTSQTSLAYTLARLRALQFAQSVYPLRPIFTAKIPLPVLALCMGVTA
jgi:hypothetical protein